MGIEVAEVINLSKRREPVAAQGVHGDSIIQKLCQWNRLRRPENFSDVAEVFIPQHTEKQRFNRRNILFVQCVQRVAQLCQQAVPLWQVRGLNRPGPVDDPPIGSEVIVPIAQVQALQTALFDIRQPDVAPTGLHNDHDAIPGWPCSGPPPAPGPRSGRGSGRS